MSNAQGNRVIGPIRWWAGHNKNNGRYCTQLLIYEIPGISAVFLSQGCFGWGLGAWSLEYYRIIYTQI